MKDPRLKKLADIIINYSTALKSGDSVLIETHDGSGDLAREVVKSAYAVGGKPFVLEYDTRTRRELIKGLTQEQVEMWAKRDADFMSRMNAYVGIRGAQNVSELSDVPSEKMNMFSKYYSEPVHTELRVKNTRWVVMRYPTSSMAQLAKMSTEAFEDFYYDVCTLDYSKMGEAMKPLVVLMDKTDKVRIVGPGDTDLFFSIKSIPTIPCDGKLNIPDGEIYTAPVKNSVNGVIHYNTPSPEEGFVYENVRLVFKDGKIIEATANDNVRINALLDKDEGARFVGEFAIGVNPCIISPMGDILFDEKIAGSIHFTPGNAYNDAFNGNNSALHWDLVMIQTPEYGGGEIYFDDVLIRKDGRFVIDELAGLNPENLK